MYPCAGVMLSPKKRYEFAALFANKVIPTDVLPSITNSSPLVSTVVFKVLGFEKSLLICNLPEEDVGILEDPIPAHSGNLPTATFALSLVASIELVFDIK